jgi:hypothetical protein
MFQKRQLVKASWEGDLSALQTLVKTVPRVLNEVSLQMKKPFVVPENCSFQPINANSQSALYLACSRNHPTLVQFLLAHPQIDVNVVDQVT